MNKLVNGLHKSILLLFLILPSIAIASVSVKAKLDSVQILMGNITMLNVEVVADKGIKGEFPLLKQRNELGVISLMNDSIELRGIADADTLDLGSGRIQMNYKMPLQSFDSGVYHLPPIQYVAGKDTFNSNRVVLKVIPVNVSENDEIEGYMPVAEPLNPSIFDKLPNAIVNYWWIILIVIIILAIILYIIIKLRKKQPIISKKIKVIPPYEKAIQSMQLLKEQKLWEQGLEREYFTRLTEILRVYLEGRFGINAMEMTSREIIQTIANDKELIGKREYVRQILDIADYVKFAKLRPLPSDNIQAFDNAMRFIEETRPIINPDQNDEDTKDTSNRKEVKQ